MNLTRFTDYAFRTLIYVAVKEHPASLEEISQAYGFSKNHLVKVVTALRTQGFIHTKRGAGGGITLAMPAEDINLGDVLKTTEPNFDIVECFNTTQNTCPITGCCDLQHVLARAHKAFLNEVAAYTLADITQNTQSLKRMIEVLKIY